MCVCETIAKEVQKIRISVVQKRYHKKATVVTGIDANKIDIKYLIKKLKSQLACGGTYKNNQLELQGDHKARVKEILEKEGFSSDMIEIE